MNRIWNKLVLFVFLSCFVFVSKTIESGSGENPQENDPSLTDDSEDNKTATSEIQEVNERVKIDFNQDMKTQAFSYPEMAKLNVNDVWANKLFEGCLILDEKDKQLLSNSVDSRKMDKKTYISYKQKLWSSNIIPYDIVSTLANKKAEESFKLAVYSALNTVSRGSCVQFRWKTSSDRNWIRFFSVSGCWSGLGRKYWTNEPTLVSLGEGCWKESIATHQLFHALGFFHEQNRPDRDDYVRVRWENIIDRKKSVFKRHALYNTDMYTQDYDFKSIMHFHRFSYSRKKWLMTITANHNKHLVLGGNKPSKLDFQRLDKMFCNGKATEDENKKEKDITRIPNWAEWSPCSRECGIGLRFRAEKCQQKKCSSVKHETSACRRKTCDYSEYATNFEKGLGIWSSPKAYKRACVWKLYSSTRNGLTDHTTGDGKFVMVDMSEAGCTKHTTVKLKSIELKKNQKWKCLNFFYYMHGKSIGGLTVRFLYKNSASAEIWKRSGDQGTDWKQGAVSLQLTDHEYQLMFEYTVDSQNGGYVLLDDIYIDDGKCIQGMQKCTDTHAECSRWSKLGECFKNAVWMTRACCKSCSLLDECVDKLQHCKSMASSGDCHSFEAEDMWKDCCRSCDDCLDKNPNCKKWQEEGECKKNPWMEKNCKKSCKLCG